MLSFLEAIRPLYSIVAATVTFVYWAAHSKNDIIEYDPRAFIFLYGVFFSNIAVSTYLNQRISKQTVGQRATARIKCFLNGDHDSKQKNGSVT